MSRPKTIRRRGLGLAELLLSLAICAALLVAAGTAVHAAMNAYQVNQERSILTQTARLTLDRLAREIRTSDAHQPHSAAALATFRTLLKGQSVTDNGIDIGQQQSDGTYVFRSFFYESTGAGVGRIMFDHDYDSSTPAQRLLDGVTDFSITFESAKSKKAAKAGLPNDILVRASIVITVRTTDATAHHSETTGLQTVTLSTAVIPRQNVW
jgi:hypothetical protein